MKKLVNLTLAVGLLIGCASAASANDLVNLARRYLLDDYRTPYVTPYNSGYPYSSYYSGYPYNSSYYNNSYYSGYNYTYPPVSSYSNYYYPNSSYYGNGYDPYYYGDTSGSRIIRRIGNKLLNWF